MCMDVVTKAFTTPVYQMVVRWKVFRVGHDGRLSLPYEYSYKDWVKTNKSCPRDEWLLSEEAIIGQESNMVYASGFHVLATERDAEEYCGAMTSYGGKAIKMEVRVMGLKAIGQANIDRADNIEHPAYVNCEVYDWMNIPSVEDVSEQEVENAIRYLFSEEMLRLAQGEA